MTVGPRICIFIFSLNTQKRVPKFVYKQLINATEKTVLKILELEEKTEYSDRYLIFTSYIQVI